MFTKFAKLFKILIIIVSITALGVSAYYVYQESNVDINLVPRVEGNVDFLIEIPKIEVNKPVIPNVDPRDETVYKAAFEQGVAHGLGTKFPGEIGNVYLYAHSTAKVEYIDRNFGWFTRLDELETGDEVIITYGQNKYIYTIASREIIDPRATGVYTAYAPVQMLTLQTCFPRGEITERLILKGLLKDTIPLADTSETGSEVSN